MLRGEDPRPGGGARTGVLLREGALVERLEEVIWSNASDAILLDNAQSGIGHFTDPETGRSLGVCIMLKLTPLQGDAMLIAVPSGPLLDFITDLVANTFQVLTPTGQAKFIFALMAAVEVGTDNA